MKILTIAALLAGAMMLSWAVAASEPAYAEFGKYDGIDGEGTDSKHDKWIDIDLMFGIEARTLPATGTSPR